MGENNKMANKEFVLYKGEKCFVQTSGRYYSTRKKHYGTRLLHRIIWIEHNGAIPEGYHIHHIDKNWRNNDISNLAVIKANEHFSKHMQEYYAVPENKETNKIILDKIREKASEWHGSKEGRSWHSVAGKESWEGRKKEKAICKTCAKEFYTFCKKTAKHCSKSCTNKYNRIHGLKTTVICPVCGKIKEKVNADAKKSACCSQSCAAKQRKKNKSI